MFNIMTYLYAGLVPKVNTKDSDNLGVAERRSVYFLRRVGVAKSIQLQRKIFVKTAEQLFKIRYRIRLHEFPRGIG